MESHKVANPLSLPLVLPILSPLTAAPVPAGAGAGAGATATVPLDPRVFTAPTRPDIVHRMVVWLDKNARHTQYKGKRRGEVRGGGRKPWRQKGTGRARQASIRSPLWKGGGVAHPPKLRDWGIDLPVKVRRLAVRSVLATKFRDGRILVVENLRLADAALAFRKQPRKVKPATAAVGAEAEAGAGAGAGAPAAGAGAGAPAGGDAAAAVATAAAADAAPAVALAEPLRRLTPTDVRLGRSKVGEALLAALGIGPSRRAVILALPTDVDAATARALRRCDAADVRSPVSLDFKAALRADFIVAATPAAFDAFQAWAVQNSAE